jgi:hypothetical protein
MDITITIATDDLDELNEAARLIDHLRGNVIEQGEIRLPPVPAEVLGTADMTPPAPAAPVADKPAPEKKPRKTKTAPAADPRQQNSPGTEPVKQEQPLKSTGDFSTPTLAAQSLARSRADGVKTVVGLLRELGVARVQDLPADKKDEFIARAKALAV